MFQSEPPIRKRIRYRELTQIVNERTLVLLLV